MNFNYLKRIYATRYFIMHLVSWDLKYRFRRSKLGVLWTILQPLMLAVMIALVFGVVFGIPMKDYAPYILSGFLVWEILQSAIVTNSYAFIKSEGYIRQCSHPVVIYPIRESLLSLVTFLIASISFMIWVLILYPENILIGLFSLPLTLFLFLNISLPISIISSHIHVRYRDYPYVFSLGMQLLWYFSPVFFMESMFKLNDILFAFFTYNPVTSILKLIRDPFLHGVLPSAFTYLYIVAISLLCWLLAFLVNKKYEKDLIFYI